MFVTVKSNRLAVALEILSRSFPVAKKDLIRHKPQLQELPGGIVDVDYKVHLGLRSSNLA